MACSSCAAGMNCACARSVARILASSLGSNSPESIDKSWPNFMAAPRISDNCLATRRALPGVSSISRGRGTLPALSCRVPSASMPPATPVAMRATLPKRFSRPVGNALPFDGSATPAFFNVKGGSLGWVNLFSRCLLSIVRMTTMI